MNYRDNPLYWSFSLGTWLSTDVRLSWYMPLFWLVFIIKFGPVYGSVISAILFVTVLVHEFGHVFGARWTGGQADEILLWPLGGLAFVQPARSLRSQVITTAAGPLADLLICLITLPFVLSPPAYVQGVWNPFVLPIASEDLGKNLIADLAIITFSLNWMTLILNLIPAHPLDGGQMLKSILNHHMGVLPGSELASKVGVVSGVLLSIVGVFFLSREMIWLAGLGMFLVVMAVEELRRVQMSELTDESEFGYDFSQGYTSLERSMPVTQEPRPSLWKRWKQQREDERRRKEVAQEQEAEAQLDAILAKLHEQGMSALTANEKRILDRASAKYRKDKPEA